VTRRNITVLRRILLLAISSACTVVVGCATIVHGGPRTIPVVSTPAGAKVTIYDRSDQLVQTNTTPFVAKLPMRYGYFRGQRYRLVFELAGHASTEVHLEPTVSGWYLGNILFGGLLGMLIIDPLTGAMYNLSPDKIEQPLSPSQSEVLSRGEGVLVVLSSQATEGERAGMVRVR
jgi:hypothetical protein